MISIYNPYGTGITYGIDTLIGTIEEHKEQVVCVYILDAPQYDGGISHSFAVVFREKNTIGQFTVLTNHHGTNSGASCGGTGSAGYCELMSCIDDYNIKIKEIHHDDTPNEWLKILLSSKGDDNIIRNTWLKVIENRIYDLFPKKSNYTINENWKEQRRRWLGHS